MKTNRLLVVDDEEQICELIRDVAEPMGFEVETVTSVQQFKNVYDDFNPSAAIIDLNIGDADGVQVLQFLAGKGSHARVVLVSGADKKLLDATRHIGEDSELRMIGTLSKPIMIDDMEAMLFKCMLRLNERKLDAGDLEKAINEGELTVHFQPIVSLSAGAAAEPISVEALVRWQHPERGLLYPDSFIAIADDGKLMVGLTDAVLLQVVEQAQVWRTAGIDVRIHVNLTCSVIDDPEFPERLSSLVRQFELEPSRLVLEFSERGSLLDILERLDILTRLRLKGFGVALDDFGTGQSSLVHLHKLPFSMLKIDRCFIDDMATSAKASVLVKSLIDLAHNLEMELCAEGVSDRDTLSKLSASGCDYAQGYIFSEAIPASEIVRNLHIWKAVRKSA